VSIATQTNTRPIARLEPRRRRLEDPAPLGTQAGGGEPMIAIRGLTKRYGHMAAVQDLTFDVHAGTVVGFLGRNGAGKSTTLNTLAGLSAPTAGTATINGVPYRSLPRPMHVAGFGLNAEAFHPSVSGRRAADTRQSDRRHPWPRARSASAGRAAVSRRPTRRQILARHASAAGTRGRAARRPQGDCARRADQRTGPTRPPVAA
jgi:energy-coupling factor transporter ATP-binding protein EcfA2